MARVDDAPASQVTGTPEVFCIVLPLAVTLTVLVHITGSRVSRGSGSAWTLELAVERRLEVAKVESIRTSRAPRMGLLGLCIDVSTLSTWCRAHMVPPEPLGGLYCWYGLEHRTRLLAGPAIGRDPYRTLMCHQYRHAPPCSVH